MSATRERRIASAQREALGTLFATKRFLRDTVKAIRATEKALSGAGVPAEIWTSRSARVGILNYQVGFCPPADGKPGRLFIRRWLNGHRGVVAGHALLGPHWKAHRDTAEILAAVALLPDLARQAGKAAKGTPKA